MRKKTTGSWVLQVLTTSLIWSLMLALSSWALAAAGWVLLALLWHRELLMPDAVRSIGLATLVILGGAAVILIAAILWARYNYRRYYLNDKRTRTPLRRPEGPGWREIAAGITGNHGRMTVTPEEDAEGEPLGVVLETGEEPHYGGEPLEEPRT